MSVFGHLEELRRRLLVSLGAWLLGCAAVWKAAPALLDALLAPLPAPAIYLGPADGFMLYCKIAMLGGAALASPVIAWQAVGFVRPALRARERRALGAVLAGGVGCGRRSWLTAS